MFVAEDDDAPGGRSAPEGMKSSFYEAEHLRYLQSIAGKPVVETRPSWGA